MTILSHNNSCLSIILRQERATLKKNRCGTGKWSHYRKCLYLVQKVGGDRHVTITTSPCVGQNPYLSLQHFGDSSADVQPPDIMRDFMGGGALRWDVV